MIKMEWHKPDCGTCKWNEKSIVPLLEFKKVAIKCGARRQVMGLNSRFTTLENCWYYEKK